LEDYIKNFDLTNQDEGKYEENIQKMKTLFTQMLPFAQKQEELLK